MSVVGINRGKQFENQVEAGLRRVPDTSVTRLIDPQAGFAGVYNVCDFIAYHYPHQFFLECKSCYGNTLSIHTNNPKNRYGAISNGQWDGLSEAALTVGTVSGVLAWFIDHDETLFIPIQVLQEMRDAGCKSVNIKTVDRSRCCIIPGIKRRVLFDYDFSGFLGG